MFLPFLPLLPIHILIQNLLCDFAQKSKSSKQLIISTFTITLITLLITFTNIATIFEHTFKYADMSEFINPDDKYPPLDMSNYKNFIKSRKLRNEAILKEKKFPDLYE